jgi:predicted ferric reductase
MEWYVVVIVSAVLLLGAIIPVLMQERRTQTKKIEQPSYNELKLQQKIFYVWYFFIGFWILMVAPKVNWTFLGYPWTGLLYAFCLWVVLGIIRFILIRFGRKRPNTNESSQEQP